MPYKASFQYQGTYLKVTLSGSLESTEELFDYAQLLVRMGEEYQTRRALVDKRKLEDKTDLMDAYQLSESKLTADSAMKGVRIACLADSTNLEHLTAYETVMQNRSLNYKIFTDEDLATAWLLK